MLPRAILRGLRSVVEDRAKCATCAVVVLADGAVTNATSHNRILTTNLY
jgi:ferredoxin